MRQHGAARERQRREPVGDPCEVPRRHRHQEPVSGVFPG
jgi:hypothetical protein